MCAVAKGRAGGRTWLTVRQRLRGFPMAVLLVTAAGLVAASVAERSATARPPMEAVWAPVNHVVAVPTVTAEAGAGRTGSGSPAQPAELAIPSIGVRSTLVDLAREPSGALPAPTDYQVAGWYASGPMPGEAGGPPAVIVGHVDSYTGPGVFYRLRDLAVGGDVEVRDIAGKVWRFRVYRLSEYPKAAFPSGEVYAPSNRAELRLITCTGVFDQRAGSYRDNLVAYATLSGGGS